MLSPFSLFNVSDIRFGRGCAGDAVSWLAQRATRVLLVHGATPRRAAFLFEGLRAAGVIVSPFSLAHEPALADIEQGVALARDAGVEAVVSLGGGAVMDAGKAIAALAPVTGPVIDYLEVVGVIS